MDMDHQNSSEVAPEQVSLLQHDDGKNRLLPTTPQWTQDKENLSNNRIQIDKDITPLDAKEHIAKLIREGPYKPGNLQVEHLLNESEPIDWIDQELHEDGVRFFQSYRLAILLAGLSSFFLTCCYRPLSAALLRTGLIHNNGRIVLRRIIQTFEVFATCVSQKDTSIKGRVAQYTYKIWKTHVAVVPKLRTIPMPPLATISKRQRREMIAIQNDVKRNPLSHAQLPENVKTYNPTNFITQLDNTIVMYGMLGIILTCPTRVGIPSDYSKRGHKGLLYSLYIAGKRLGVDDDYNLGLMTQAHGQEIINQLLLPCYADIDENNIEMYTSVRIKDYWSPWTLIVIFLKGLCYRTSLRFILGHVLELELKEFSAFFRWYDYMLYYAVVTVMWIYVKVGFVRWILNVIVKIATPVAINVLYLLLK